MRKYDIAIDNYFGQMFELSEWYAALDDGFIMSDDGAGYWVKDNMTSYDEVFSSEPLDATHVVWYNK